MLPMDQMGAGGGPPLPPSAMPASGGQGAPPQGNSFQSLAGKQQPGGAGGPGASQVSGALVRLGMEIDQALKLLAQAAPQLSGWVDQTTQELRAQIGVALQSGVPTSATPQGQGNFPGGGQNL